MPIPPSNTPALRILTDALADQAAARARAAHARKNNPHNAGRKIIFIAPPRLPHGLISSGFRVADRAAQSLAPNFPRIGRDDLRMEARTAFALWLVKGPRRSDESQRFARWKMRDASLALWRRFRAGKPVPLTLHLSMVLKVEALASRLLTEGKCSPVKISDAVQLRRMSADESFLTAEEVMFRYRYKCRKSFWKFVREEAVPHISFNACKKMFSPVALKTWEERRTVGLTCLT
jgi:hypothetical protein